MNKFAAGSCLTALLFLGSTTSSTGAAESPVTTIRSPDDQVGIEFLLQTQSGVEAMPAYRVF